MTSLRSGKNSRGFRQGFAKWSLSSRRRPYKYQEGVLVLKVDPGNRLEVTIEGNSSISTKRLKKEVPFFDTETVNDETIDEAVIRMRALYQSEGYVFAQVAPVLKEDGNTIEYLFLSSKEAG